MKELIKEIAWYQDEIDAKNAEIEKLKTEVADLENTLETKKATLMEDMIKTGDLEIEADNLIASYFKKSEFSYGDEKALLNKLIEDQLMQYITNKVTQSINKKELKKALKEDLALKDSLKDFIGDRTTEYVVVTTKENHEKMLEHMKGTK